MKKANTTKRGEVSIHPTDKSVGILETLFMRKKKKFRKVVKYKNFSAIFYWIASIFFVWYVLIAIWGHYKLVKLFGTVLSVTVTMYFLLAEHGEKIFKMPKIEVYYEEI